MATTLKLPFVRFVAQVNTAPAEPKANYQALAARNALALQSCEWREAAKSAKASLVTHNFTVSHAGDQYDAYLMTGDYNAENSTEVAYAGIAAYRFSLPAAYIDGSQTLVSMSLPITRDRFLLPGVRVVVVLSDSAQPSASWAVVRGEASPAASETEYLKNSATRITAALDDSGTLELDLAGTDTTKKPYLWIYLTVEDYSATWTMYSKTEPRLYAIEGSAMIVGEDATVTFSADVAQDCAFCYGKYDLFTGEFTKWFDLVDDSVKGVHDTGDVGLGDGTSIRFVSICGENIQPSLSILPGFAIYDVTNGRHISLDTIPRIIKKTVNGGATTETDITEDFLLFFSRRNGVGTVSNFVESQASVTDGFFKVTLLVNAQRIRYLKDETIELFFAYNPSTGAVRPLGIQSSGINIHLFSSTVIQEAQFSEVEIYPVNIYLASTKTGLMYYCIDSIINNGMFALDSGNVTHVNTIRGNGGGTFPYWHCISGTFNKLNGITCNGLAVVRYNSESEGLQIAPAYPLPLNFDNSDDIVFFSYYGSNELFVSGSFKTINGVRVDGCAFILEPEASWLLERSNSSYEEPKWNKVIIPCTFDKISNICSFQGISYDTFPNMALGSNVSCMRKNRQGD